MNEQLTDQVLIERVQNGDKQAFNLLVTKYQNKVCNLISRYVNNPGDVPDVAQEAFIKAYRAIPSFRGESASILGYIELLLILRKTTSSLRVVDRLRKMWILKKLNITKLVVH